MPRPKTEAAQFTSLMLRLPPDVHEACKARARKYRRSLNAQLLWMLEASLKTPEENQTHELVGSRND